MRLLESNLFPKKINNNNNTNMKFVYCFINFKVWVMLSNLLGLKNFMEHLKFLLKYLS